MSANKNSTYAPNMTQRIIYANIKKILTRPMPSVEARKKKLLLELTICTWIVAAFLSIAFYVAVRNNQMGTEWLAGLLLGIIVLGWIMIVRYFSVANRF